jgi:hypothetical protein
LVSRVAFVPPRRAGRGLNRHVGDLERAFERGRPRLAPDARVVGRRESAPVLAALVAAGGTAPYCARYCAGDVAGDVETVRRLGESAGVSRR